MKVKSERPPKMFEMFDLSVEARHERIQIQINEVVKTLIPTTQYTNGMSDHRPADKTYRYYQFFLGMGNIQLKKHKTPPANCTSYFTVESENKSWKNSRGHCWDYHSKIISVSLKILVVDERENSIAQELLLNAQAILA